MRYGEPSLFHCLTPTQVHEPQGTTGNDIAHYSFGRTILMWPSPDSPTRPCANNDFASPAAKTVIRHGPIDLVVPAQRIGLGARQVKMAPIVWVTTVR